MARIAASQVSITPVYLVDCEACGEAVTEGSIGDNSYGYDSLQAARAAKKDHLEKHESGFFE